MKELLVNNKKSQTLNIFDMMCSGYKMHVRYARHKANGKTDMMSYGR